MFIVVKVLAESYTEGASGLAYVFLITRGTIKLVYSALSVFVGFISDVILQEFRPQIRVFLFYL